MKGTDCMVWTDKRLVNKVLKLRYERATQSPSSLVDSTVLYTTAPEHLKSSPKEKVLKKCFFFNVDELPLIWLDPRNVHTKL